LYRVNTLIKNVRALGLHTYIVLSVLCFIGCLPTLKLILFKEFLNVANEENSQSLAVNCSKLLRHGR